MFKSNPTQRKLYIPFCLINRPQNGGGKKVLIGGGDYFKFWLTEGHLFAQSFVFFLFSSCTMHELRNTLLLVSSSVRSKQLLCFVHGQGQKSEQKHTTKSFDEFHNHSPLLTMLEGIKNDNRTCK